MHVFGHFNGQSGKSSMNGLGDTTTGSNNDVSGDGEFTMWQDALIFTNILMMIIITGIMGYFFAKLREDCWDSNKCGAEEMGSIQVCQDATNKDHFMDLTEKRFANREKKPSPF